MTVDPSGAEELGAFDLLLVLSRLITARAAELERLRASGDFDQATADARLAELLSVERLLLGVARADLDHTRGVL